MTTVDIVDFARRVERLCDFLLDKVSKENSRDGSDDIMEIEKLKDIAADLQFDEFSQTASTLSGLHSYMKGVPVEKEV